MSVTGRETHTDLRELRLVSRRQVREDSVTAERERRRRRRGDITPIKHRRAAAQCPDTPGEDARRHLSPAKRPTMQHDLLVSSSVVFLLRVAA